MGRLATPAWLLRHVLMVALVVIFLRLGWWQFTRAEGGNGLSIGYTLEWPAFAVFVIFVWWREVRMTLRATPSDPDPAPASQPRQQPGIPGVARFDLGAARAARVEHAAHLEAAQAPSQDSDYNRYLAWLAEHPDARPSDYRMHKLTEGAPAHE